MNPKITWKDIKKGWLNKLPCLVAYKSNQLVRRIGPVLIGLELQRFDNLEYTPNFIITSLLNTKEIEPAMYQPLKTTKGFPMSISFNKHIVVFEETLTLLEEQQPWPICSSKQPTLTDITYSIIKFLKHDYYGNPYFPCMEVVMLSEFIDEKSRKENIDECLKIIKSIQPDILNPNPEYDKEFLKEIQEINKIDLERNYQKNIENPTLKKIPGISIPEFEI